MKLKATIVTSMLVISSSAFAQDFAEHLTINQGIFNIYQHLTKVTDTADVSSYNKQVPVIDKKTGIEKEVFSYSSKKKLTPKSGLFGKHREMQLVVERLNGKVVRVSTVDFAQPKDKKSKPSELYQTISYDENGKVKSETNCASAHATKLPGVISTLDQTNSCVTINQKVCELIDTHKLDEAFNAKAKECRDVYAQLAEYQSEFKNAVDKDYSSDSDALDKIPTVSAVSAKQNFFELGTSTLAQVSRVADGYAQATSRCKFFKERDILASSAIELKGGKNKKSESKVDQED
jgi:hypothetical protein